MDWKRSVDDRRRAAPKRPEEIARVLEEIARTRALQEAQLRRAATLLPETARSCPAAHNRALLDRD